MSELRSVTCHMSSHLPPDTGERAPSKPQPGRLVLDLPTPEDGRLSWSWWLVIYWDGFYMSIYVLTGPGVWLYYVDSPTRVNLTPRPRATSKLHT